MTSRRCAWHTGRWRWPGGSGKGHGRGQGGAQPAESAEAVDEAMSGVLAVPGGSRPLAEAPEGTAASSKQCPGGRAAAARKNQYLMYVPAPRPQGSLDVAASAAAAVPPAASAARGWYGAYAPVCGLLHDARLQRLPAALCGKRGRHLIEVASSGRAAALASQWVAATHAVREMDPQYILY